MATSPNATPTPITPPRVPFIDPRTGLIDRAWYQFLLSLFRSAETVEGSNLGPPTQDISGELDNLRSELEIGTQPRQELGTMAALQQDNLPWVRFDTTPQSVPDTVTGTLYWDDADRSKTLAVVMEDTGQIVQDIGEETFYRVKASSAITKGQVLMFTGTVGASGGILAAPATGLTVAQSEYILGVATQDIALNSWGYATWFGEIKGVNTTGGAEAWVDGQILYYNPAVAGGLTKNVPTAPNVKVIVAAVVHAATNGILFVRPTFGSSLGDNSNNVQITSPANGHLLIYDAVQARWENAALTAGSNISITNGAGSVTIASTYAPSGATGSVTLAEITPGGTQGSLTFANGLITAFVAPT
jgi:hypothetical protein